MKTQFRQIFFYTFSIFTIYSCSNTGNNTTTSDTTANNTETSTTINAAANIAGTYSFGNNIEKEAVGSVKIYPITNDSVIFFLDVNLGAPSYNSGQLLGKMEIKDSVATYQSKAGDNSMNCALSFHFSDGQVTITTDSSHNDCGFGGNVTADHTFKLIDKTTPEYYINGTGDTIFFKGLSVD
ncbi:MAG: hypothetical protein JST21_06925 [Bacteroidetes bacterium]|nr:hypothetical protein [Bacteroidota bacterium]